MENIKNKILFLIVLLLTISMISASPFYYKINLDYNKGDINIKEINVIYSQEDLKDNFGDYNLDVFDLNNKKIDSQNFIVPNIRMYDNGDENGNIIGGGIVVLNNVSFEVYVPYYSNAKEIIIYNNEGKELAKTDVSIYSKVEGNKLIEDNKNQNIDSSEKTQKKDTETDKTSSSNVSILEKIGNYWWVLLIILVVLVVVLFYPRKRKKK